VKKYYIFIVLMGIFNFLAYANENIRFFWSFGDMGFSIDHLKDEFKMVPYINVGNINWVTKHGLGWRFNVFNIEWNENNPQSLILPLEINYSPFGDNAAYLFLTLYGRGGWMLKFNNDSASLLERSSFFGAVGLRTAWFPTVGKYWSVFTGAFIEYTTKNELRIGVSIDTGIIVALATIIFGNALRDSDD
jgi:hypothetical protein